MIQHFLGETSIFKKNEGALNMFALKYINRHFFMEHEDRLYLVDTGCPISFAVNEAIPWTERTPDVVILDAQNGRIRFTGGQDQDPHTGKVFAYEKAPATKAPIFRCSRSQRMIWDTGAQIGYMDMGAIPKENIIKETGPFRDFSPVYGPIESPMTWLVRFDLELQQDPLPWHPVGIAIIPWIRCEMAVATPAILADIRREGVDGILGNSWMRDDEGVIITIKARKGEATIHGIQSELHPTTSSSWPLRMNRETWRRMNKADEGQPVTEAPARQPTMRKVPRSLNNFSTEELRRHLMLDNIDGLIGNDLLQDTLL